MNTETTETIDFDAEKFAWECFCLAHPLEAAAQDFPRYAAFVRQQNPVASDSEIKRCLLEAQQEG